MAGTQANAIAVSRVPGKAGVIIAGSMWNGMSEGGDILFVKYGATSGATKWWRTIGNGEAFDESAQEVAIDPRGGAVVVGPAGAYAAGETANAGSGTDALLVKF